MAENGRLELYIASVQDEAISPGGLVDVRICRPPVGHHESLRPDGNASDE